MLSQKKDIVFTVLTLLNSCTQVLSEMINKDRKLKEDHYCKEVPTLIRDITYVNKVNIGT